ncbi:hypothetical protein MNBD_GAMMA23-2177 [hydrothermal vent metagenome]|uniref:Uncharacterized protein n=1 Tax=hydrothermal vent metagenome TaxID=652676 RepID=A0A3B0ZY02_9ZZZZ
MKGRKTINLLLLLWGVAVTANIQATETSQPLLTDSNNEAARLWLKIQHIYHGTQKAAQYTNGDALQPAVRLLSAACDIKHPGYQLAQALQTEAQQMGSRKGVSFRGGYTSDNLADQTKDANAYLELSWDLWRQGLTENRQRARSLAYQSAIARLRAQQAQQKLDFRCRRYAVGQTFSGLLSHLLTLKLSLMEPVYQIEKRAYFKNWSFLDDLLVSEQDILLLRQELKYLHSDPYRDATINKISNLPLVDVDILAVIKKIREDDHISKINSLEKQILAEKNNRREGDRLRLFVRKQFDVGNRNDNGVVAGFRFSIPLEKQRNQAEAFRLAHIDQQTKLQTWERITRTRAAYQSLQEQMQRSIKQQYRYRRAHERVRRTLVEKKLDQQIQLASAVTRLRSLLDASIELVRAKEELYRRVNQVFLMASIEFNPSFIQLTSLSKNTNRARKGERSIYLWSKGFNKFSNDQIFDFLEAKGINRVLLTAGRAVNREKMQRFIKQARNKQLHIESIVGSNKLFFTENHMTAALAVDAASTISDAIHLDIEPHTFAGYKQNKAAYLQQYLEMLRTIRKQSPNVTLTVAVPFHWPADVYSALNEMVDRVYIMAYGSTKPAIITRRLQAALKTMDAEKIVIVLRVTDFSDEWAIEKMVASLQQQTGIQKYSLHMFRRFIAKAGK